MGVFRQFAMSDKKRRRPAEPVPKRKKRKVLDEDGNEVKQVPITQEMAREADDTIVAPDDHEVFEDEQTDEFASYFNRTTAPHVLITTTTNPSQSIVKFAKELKAILGWDSTEYKKRTNITIKDIVKGAIEHDFTDLMVISEHKGKPYTLTLVHLPEGPTAQFRITNLVMRKDIPNHGRPTDHTPELILNNFSTRLGHTVGRMFASLFPHDPEFVGRRVITFHNQRDFIFFRQHRYIFDGPEKARIQELGPRFTLKLRWLQRGTFSLQHGEYEWHQKKEIETGRRRFFL